jgi:hypothetical protein
MKKALVMLLFVLLILNSTLVSFASIDPQNYGFDTDDFISMDAAQNSLVVTAYPKIVKSSQPTEVTIYVKDENGNPVEGAYVDIDGGKWTGYTTNEGEFTVEIEAQGSRHLNLKVNGEDHHQSLYLLDDYYGLVTLTAEDRYQNPLYGFKGIIYDDEWYYGDTAVGSKVSLIAKGGPALVAVHFNVNDENLQEDVGYNLYKEVEVISTEETIIHLSGLDSVLADFEIIVDDQPVGKIALMPSNRFQRHWHHWIGTNQDEHYITYITPGTFEILGEIENGEGNTYFIHKSNIDIPKDQSVNINITEDSSNLARLDLIFDQDVGNQPIYNINLYGYIIEVHSPRTLYLTPGTYSHNFFSLIDGIENRIEYELWTELT